MMYYGRSVNVLCILLVLVATALWDVAGLARGQVLWTLDGNGAWENPDNWSSAPALPGASDEVVLDVGGPLMA